MLAAYIFQSGQFEKQLWIMLGFAAALNAVAQRPSTSSVGEAEYPLELPAEAGFATALDGGGHDDRLKLPRDSVPTVA